MDLGAVGRRFMTGDGRKLIGKNLEESSRGQIEVLYWNLPR
jgi:hypothetical protein